MDFHLKSASFIKSFAEQHSGLAAIIDQVI